MTGKLLRVAKAGTKAFHYRDLQSYWETAVQPLFQHADLVQQSLIRIGGNSLSSSKAAVIARFNAAVQAREQDRRADFKGSTVADADLGMLVEDMRKSELSCLGVPIEPPSKNKKKPLYHPSSKPAC